MKKIVSIISLCLVALFSLTLVACGNNTTKNKKFTRQEKEINPSILANNPESDKEILISYSLAGFGEEWIKEAVDAFNAVYEGHGYKAVLGRSDANFTSESLEIEFKYPKENEYDLYFAISENVLSSLIQSSYSTLKTKDQVLLADLSDILDQKPIDLYGYEEEKTIKELLDDTSIMFTTYTTGKDSKWYGNLYGFQWTRSISGMVINMDVLRQFGYTEIPRTTKELKAVCDHIMQNSQNSKLTGSQIYPITWPGANASGYITYTFLTWLAQYMGKEGYDNFYSLNNDDIEKGYEVYDNIGIQYAFDAMRTFVDQNYATNGTVTTIDHLTSEQILADGEALIAFTGDWCYNEIINCGYEDSELTNIEMLPVPVLSEVADLVKLPGDEATKDQLLSAIIKDLDEGKTIAEIIANVSANFSQTVTEDQVKRIAEARGIYFDMGTTHYCLVPSYSDNIEGAKLFLRFIFSKDCCENIYSAYAHAVNANTSSNPQQTNYLKSLARITSSPYACAIGFEDKLSEIRMNGGISFAFEPFTHWTNIAKNMAVGDPEHTGENIYNRVKTSMKNNWPVILAAAGMIEE